MTFPLSHHISRHPMRCKLQTRAIEGAFAAERLDGVKQAFESYRQEWHAFHRAFDEAGDNYRAAHELEIQLADEIMHGLFRDYDTARQCEWAAIEIERKAA